VAIQPAGVGVVTAPGQLLDPLNDLIEQFSSLMLAASVAFGVQILLVEIGSSTLVSVALSVAALAWLGVALWRRRVPTWLTRALLVVAFVRFAAPISVMGSDLVYAAFMADNQAEEGRQEVVGEGEGHDSELA
jgi:thiol:disulfide interchange protein